MTWVDSYKYCNSMNSTLVEFHTEEVMDFLIIILGK